MEHESDSEEEEAVEAPPPAKRRKTAPQGAKAVSDAWRTTPSVPWPQLGSPSTRACATTSRTRRATAPTGCLMAGRRPVCVCQKDGLCGVRATSTTRPGYAVGCALREDHLDQYKETKKQQWRCAAGMGGQVGPHWQGAGLCDARGKECVTQKSDGAAMKLCDCGECFKPCKTLEHTHATGCLFNTAPKCKDCPAVATMGEYCSQLRCGEESYRGTQGGTGAGDSSAHGQAQHQARARGHHKGQAQDALCALSTRWTTGSPTLWSEGAARSAASSGRQGARTAFISTLQGLLQLGEDGRPRRSGAAGVSQRIVEQRSGKRLASASSATTARPRWRAPRSACASRSSRRWAFPPSAIDDTYFGTDGEVCDVDKPRRPDAPWLGPDRAVLCETDENSHMNSGYEPECCATWASDMTEALVSLYRDQGLDGDALRVFLVRWNPDARDRCRPVIRQEERARIVGERIKALREMPAEELAKFPPMVPIVIYYYYHSKAQRWIDYARASDGILVHEVVE